MQKKRLIALFLTVVLALSLFCVPTAAVSEDVTLTFSLTEVKGTEPTLELGLNVQTGDTEEFKSVGVVLEFDSSVLTLIPWDNDEPAYDLSNADKWSNAVPIGTKGIDEYMGSAAQAYESEDKTYLYMSAEAINPTALPQSTRVATVRFAYNEGMSAENVIGGVTVKLADAPAIVAASPIQHGVVYHNDKLFYHYNYVTFDGSGAADFDDSAEDVDYLTAPTFESVQEGESAGGGSGSAADFAAVVFYDWDETLLGTVIVPKGDATQQVEEFTNARIADPSELDEKYLWYSNEKIAADEADSGKTPKYLSNKKGYDFDAWLLNDSDTFTAQDTALPKYDGTNDAAAEVAGVANFTNVTGDMIVKAGYAANATLNKLDNGATNSMYTILEPIYNRYGAAAVSTGAYSLQITVKRENADGYGVTRLREPGFRVNTTPDIKGAVPVDALNLMENKDITDVEIAVPKMVRTAAYAVIETYETPNWPGTAQKSNVMNKYKNSGTTDNDLIGTDGFVKEGTIGFINTQCLIYLEQGSNTSWTLLTNNQAFQDAGLTEPVGNPITNSQAAANRALIEAAIIANGYQPLTYEQMRAALSLP